MITWNERFKINVDGVPKFTNFTELNTNFLPPDSVNVYGNSFGCIESEVITEPYMKTKTYDAVFTSLIDPVDFNHVLLSNTVLFVDRDGKLSPRFFEDIQEGDIVQDADFFSKVCYKCRRKKWFSMPSKVYNFRMGKYKKFMLKSGLYVGDYDTERTLRDAN